MHNIHRIKSTTYVTINKYIYIIIIKQCITPIFQFNVIILNMQINFSRTRSD